MTEISRAIRIAVTAVFVIVALFFVRWMWIHYELEPWTRDGRVRADTVEVAPDVSGLVVSVSVHDNSPVQRGQVLFLVDPVRYRLALEQAEAAIKTDQAALDEAKREAFRNRVLGKLASVELSDQTRAKVEEDEAALAQAIANRDVARVNLERTAVRALVPGSATNVQLRPGDYAAAGRTVMAVIDSESLHIDGYFEETKLPRIHPGDSVRAYLMGHRYSIEGHVESIAGGIVDRERQTTESPLADINPTFNWVRLAQRVPVRIHIDRVPADTRLVAGLTTTVIVHPSRGTQDQSFWPW
jgi:RND family efflux transporter MFP subunit